MNPGTQDRDGHGRAAFAFIFVTVLLDMLALGIIIPVLPKLIVTFKHGDSASAATVLGVFGTMWAAMQFIAAPVLGSLSDRFGRRPVVLLSNFGLGLDYLLMAWAPTLGWLFAGRIISGATSGSYATAYAYVTDVTPPERRSGKFGLLGAAFGLGFIIGPAVGGMLGGINLRMPFWGAGGLSLLNAAYGFFILPESLPRERRSPFTWRHANPLGALRLLRSHRTLFALAGTAFLVRVAHDVMPSLFVLYGDYRYQWSARTLGLILAGVGVATTIVQAGLVGPIVKRLGERAALLAGLSCATAAYVIYALASTGGMFLAGIPLGSFFGLSSPALQGLMTRLVGPTEQGQLQGANASVMGIAGMIAPLLFTQTFAQAIGPFRGLGLPGAPFLLAAMLLVAAMLIAGRATRARRA